MWPCNYIMIASKYIVWIVIENKVTSTIYIFRSVCKYKVIFIK